MLQASQLQGDVAPASTPLTDELSLYREIFDRSMDAIAIIDPAGFYLQQNDAHEAMCGYSIDELRGRTPAIHMGDAVFADVFHELQRNGRYEGEIVSRARDGRTSVLELRAFATRDVTGEVTGYVGVKRDITQRRQHEEELQDHFARLEALYTMTATVSRSLPLEAIYEEALQALRAAVGADRASVLVFDADDVMRFKASSGLSEEYQRAVEGHSPWQRDSHDPQPFGVSDVANELQGELREIILREGIRACAFIPLIAKGRLFGKFMVYYDQPHCFREDELRLTQTIAKQIALAITRAETENAVRAREREYKNLADHMPQIVARFAPDLTYSYINPAVKDVTGLEPESFIGRKASTISIAPEVGSLWQKRLARCFETCQQVHFEFTFPTPHGIRNYSTELVPEFDDTGAVTSVMSITTDMTERVQTEERQRFLAEISTRLVESLDYESTLLRLAKMMIESIADGCAIDIADHDGTLRRICVVAREAQKARLVEELEARFPTPMDSPAGNVTAFRTGQPGLYTTFPDELLRSVSVNDEHYALWQQIGMQSCMCLPLNARGRTLGVITLVSHDALRLFGASDLAFAEEIAQRAALVIDNARLYQEAHDASMAKSAFLATMSHELRTPLNAILGYAELMELGVAGSVTSQQGQQLERIRASAWHLLTVIEEILTFSRVEAGREEVNVEIVDVADLVMEATSMVEPAAERKVLDLVVSTPEHAVTLRTDRGKVRQILLNLLSNAIKFTEAGTLRCTAEIVNNSVRFRVSDTGVGIPEEHRERVFEAFWQAGQGATRKTGGTGLGLTVSRQLAHLLGGDVTLESTPGVGSTFTLTLPSLA